MVEADPARPIALDEVAREIAASRRSLQRAFESEGITFRQAVAVARIRRAKGLLARGDLPIYAVAARVGYQSKAEFTKAFKRHVGTMPSEYKRAMRERRALEAERHPPLAVRPPVVAPSPVAAPPAGGQRYAAA